MHILTNLQKTINWTFEIYRSSFNSYYNLSLPFTIASGLFAMVLSGIICFVMSRFVALPYFDQSDLLNSLLSSPDLIRCFRNILTGIMVFNIGLYGVFLLKTESKVKEDGYKLAQFFDEISMSIWQKYFLLLILLLFGNILLFQNVFATDTFDIGAIPVADGFASETKMLKFYRWVNSLFELLREFLPFFLAMTLIVFHLESKTGILQLMKYKVAFLTAFILSFCIDTLSQTTVNYINYYLINLFRVPFENDLFPGLFGGLLGILIVAAFYLGFAAFITYPFKFEKTEVSKNIVNF